MKKCKIIFLFVLVSAFLLQAGCAKNPKVTPEDAATAIQNEFLLLVGSSDSDSSNPVIAAIAEGFAVEVTSVDKAEGGYLVKCILSNYDTVAAFEASEEIEGEMTLDDYGQLMAELLVQQERCRMETEMPLTILDDGSYQVVFNDEQLDAAMGGLISYYNQLLEEVG